MRIVKYKPTVLPCLAALGMLAILSIPSCAQEITPTTEYSVGEYTVKQDGSGDFDSIQEGVDALPSGSTLIIYPGTYDESVNIDEKTINLRGTDRDTCIMTYNTQYYPEPVLNLGAGKISNLTLDGYRSDTYKDGTAIPTADEIRAKYAETKYSKISTYMAYTIHIDSNYLYGKEVSFDNCTIISANSQCVGIGTRGDSSITFRDCDFTQRNGSAIMFFHDSVVTWLVGDTTIGFENCHLTCNGGKHLFDVETYYTESHIELLFQNNVLSDIELMSVSNNYDDYDYQWQGANNVRLSSESRGNSIEELNF